MRIKLSLFKSRLKHSEAFEKENELFINGIESALGAPLEYAEFSDYDCDVKLLFVQTGGSEGLFLREYENLREPFYLLTNGGNNSLAASMEIATYLGNAGKKCEILHGNASYVANRIKHLALIDGVKNKLAKTRLGVIGTPSDWLIASVPDYKTVKHTLGATLVNIPLEEVETLVKNGQTAGAKRSLYPNCDKKELDAALEIYDALYTIKNKYALNGLTLRCFDLLSSVKSTGCLALAELNGLGITGTCEGDVAAMITMFVASLVTGESNFQANPARIDVENNAVTFAHCTVPLDMVESYRFDTHFESGIGVAVKGEMRKTRVTIFRISADLKRYFVSEGTVIANLNEHDLCRTQIEVKLDKPATELLKTPCGNHHVITYGEHAETFTQLMDELIGEK